MSKRKIVTPAQKVTAAQAAAEIAKAKAAADAAKIAKAKAEADAKAARIAAEAAAREALKGKPAHYTLAGNKKHQANGPAIWEATFLKAARQFLGPDAKLGDGVRLALQ